MDMEEKRMVFEKVLKNLSLAQKLINESRDFLLELNEGEAIDYYCWNEMSVKGLSEMAKALDIPYKITSSPISNEEKVLFGNAEYNGVLLQECLGRKGIND